MTDYLIPDSRWEIYNFKGIEDYVDQVVLKGYFHKDVHEDVVKSFRRAEYMMVNAYYNWELFDEALKKCLFVLEMAIKLKAEEKNIDTYKVSKKGKKINKHLSQIINDICKGSYQSHFKRYLDKARELRNHFAHPEKHHFSGPNGNSIYIMHIVNVLNRLFKDDEWLEAYAKETTILGGQIEELNKNILQINVGVEEFLITRIFSYEIVDNHLILCVLPLLNNYKVSEYEFTGDEPETYCIKDFEITKNGITGILDDKLSISVSILNNINAQRVLKRLHKFQSELSEAQNSINKTSLEYHATEGMVKAEYLHYKKSFQSN